MLLLSDHSPRPIPRAAFWQIRGDDGEGAPCCGSDEISDQAKGALWFIGAGGDVTEVLLQSGKDDKVTSSRVEAESVEIPAVFQPRNRSK